MKGRITPSSSQKTKAKKNIEDRITKLTRTTRTTTVIVITSITTTATVIIMIIITTVTTPVMKTLQCQSVHRSEHNEAGQNKTKQNQPLNNTDYITIGARQQRRQTD